MMRRVSFGASTGRDGPPDAGPRQRERAEGRRRAHTRATAIEVSPRGESYRRAERTAHSPRRVSPSPALAVGGDHERARGREQICKSLGSGQEQICKSPEQICKSSGLSRSAKARTLPPRYCRALPPTLVADQQQTANRNYNVLSGWRLERVSMQGIPS